MSPDALLEELRRRGVRLWVEGDRLRYQAPEGALDRGLLDGLRLSKPEIIRHLRAVDAVTVHPVSHGQRALWFVHRLDPAGSAYNYAFSARIRSELNVDAMRRSFQAIVDRHEVLRTTYAIQDGDPVQQVRAYEDVAFAVLDASGWTDDELQVRVHDSAHRPFDLERGPVFRVELYSRSPADHLLLVNAHHLAMDFQSLAIIMDELRRLYAAECRGSGASLPIVQTQYADFARWQAAMLESPAGERHWEFWRKYLEGGPPLLNLPTDRPRPAVRTYNGSSVESRLDAEESRAVRELARSEKVTLYTVLLACFETLLHRYTGQDDLMIGSPMLGRTRSEFERVVGYFISPAVLRADCSGDPTFRELLQRTQAAALAVLEHQDYPFPLLVHRLQPARDPSRSPFFDVMFNLNAAQVEESDGHLRLSSEERGGGDLVLEPEPQAQGEGQFDLILQIFDSGRSLAGTLEFNTDLFDRVTAERMAGHFRTLLKGAVGDPTRRLSMLPLLTDPERTELLAGATGSSCEPPSVCIHELFEAQVARTPDAVALTFEGQSLSYQELNTRANRLAHRLRSLGVGPEVLVGICVERSLEMVVGLLGILKAGGAYVPLDPAYPTDRLAYMLADSAVRVVLTQERLLGHLATDAAKVICLDRDWESIATEPDANVASGVLPGHPAYVIYTSGSTGRPKGVVVCHDNVVRLFSATQAWFSFDEHDVWTLFHSYAFDFSVWELWGALCHGGRLVVVPYLVSRSPEGFCRLLAEEGVTVLNQTPSAFRQLIEAEGRDPLPADSPLRLVIFGGEALDLGMLRPWYQRRGDRRPLLVNMYGITETTVHVTYRPLSMADVEAGVGSMIGRPIPDLALFVLDSHGQPVPVGVPGELFVGGAGLARGYLNQPGLTAARFIANPFSRNTDERLYRTGDLVRRRPDGDMEYLGRVDQQVKIRGFRIELGEIESVLRQQPGVRDAVVVAHGESLGEKRLTAYVVAGGVSVDDLRRAVRDRLPDYMVPATFVLLESFPLTPSGKVDRRALPDIASVRAETQDACEAPATDAERILADVWAEVLRLERVGVNDNFFDLGGDSILSIRVLAAAQERGLAFTLSQLFQFQTVRELAAQVGTPGDRTEPSVKARLPFSLLADADAANVPADVEDAYPLARLQAGMLFHAQLSPDSAIYCNLSSLHLRMPFDAERLQAAINHVVARHPSLRTSFDLTGFSEPVQLVHRKIEVPLVVSDLRHLPTERQDVAIREWMDRERVRGFDASRPPLLRFHVHRRTEETLQFTWCEHHAILDGWSVAAMLTELVECYLRSLGGKVRPEQPVPVVGYGDFVVLERETVASQESQTYWRDRLSGLTVPRLPRWQRRDNVEAALKFGHRNVPIGKDLSAAVKNVAREAGVPVKSVLLAAHLKVLECWAGTSDVLTGLIANGRPETADGDRVLGLFLNTVPIRQQLGIGSWLDLARQADATEREALPHRRFPLAEIQHAIGVHDLIETSFNFIHFHVYQGLNGLDGFEVLGVDAFERTNFTMMATFGLDPLSPESEIGLTLHYDAGELCDAQVSALAESYRHVLATLAADPAGRYELITGLSDESRRRLLVDFNSTAASYPKGQCIHELFEAQVDRAPNAVALMANGLSVTYAELDARANRLARHLRSLGVGPEKLVGVLSARKADLVVALLAVLKSGGAYVPVDPAYPHERLRFILEDTAAPVVLTQAGLVERLSGYEGRVVCLDRDAVTVAAQASDRLNADQPSSSNLAYVIYTSGSTGRPKGVAIEHRSTVELLHWARRMYSPAELAGVLASTSVCFDLSVFELFVPLSWGGTVILAENALALPSLPEASRVTLINTVPSAMAELVRLRAIPPSVRTVNLAGEPLTTPLADSIYALGTVSRVFDLYGPSEDTTYSTVALRMRTGRATIGRPISNTSIYILDSMGRPVPVGVPGEVYIHGSGLARGYLDRPDLTAERFVPDPFRGESGARMYRTGDLARYAPDGSIDFLGRLDHQVKIRGFRIELGEIEARLRECGGVADAVVVAGECGEGTKQLAGYLVAGNGAEIELDTVRRILRERLPEYMIPAAFVVLRELPRTPNGKVDRKALPAPDVGRGERTSSYVPPQDEIEAAVAAVWSALLGVSQVGIHDNFFELGGHSLLATQAVSRLRDTFQVQLPLRSLFDDPTVAGMAAAIRASGVGVPSLVGSEADREEFEL